MEKLQNRLADKNLRELKQMALLIDEYCKPQLIILFGEYAGTTVRSEIGGYELLVIVEKKNLKTDREELQNHVRQTYPPAERFEQNLFIHLLTVEFFLSQVRTNFFLNTVLKEGITLHDTKTLPLEYIDLGKSVKLKHRQAAEENVKRCMNFADILLADAETNSITKDWRICGFYIYYALEQLLMALEYKQYGFRREYDHISRQFHVALHGSAALNEFYESRKNEILKMFKGLTKLRDDSLYSESYGYPDETVFRYLEIIKKMRKIAENDLNS